MSTVAHARCRCEGVRKLISHAHIHAHAFHLAATPATSIVRVSKTTKKSVSAPVAT